MALGEQRLNCLMRGFNARLCGNSAVDRRVLWNQSPEFVKKLLGTDCTARENWIMNRMNLESERRGWT